MDITLRYLLTLYRSARKNAASLVEVDAGSAAEEIIRGYIHKKVKTKDDGSARKLSGMFSSEFKGKEHQQDRKIYRYKL